MTKTARKRHDPLARFMKYVARLGSGCWIWVGAKSGSGYGWFWSGIKYVGAHQWSYEHFVGPVPEGMELGHAAKCHNRACVNYKHVSPMTTRQNLLMDNTPAARNLAKTHCPSGHLYGGENLHIDKKGKRHCRRCNSIRSSIYQKAKRRQLRTTRG